MEIKSLKELQKLIQLCRKMGVEAIEVEGVKMNLGPTPVIMTKNRTKMSNTAINTTTYAPGGITEDTNVPTASLTEEQLLFYSAQDHMSNEEQ